MCIHTSVVRGEVPLLGIVHMHGRSHAHDSYQPDPRPNADHDKQLYMPSPSAPEQLRGVVAPVPFVDRPVPQAVQLGRATSAVAPADHEPTAHTRQLSPPKPTRQAAGRRGGGR